MNRKVLFNSEEQIHYKPYQMDKHEWAETEK